MNTSQQNLSKRLTAKLITQKRCKELLTLSSQLPLYNQYLRASHCSQDKFTNERGELVSYYCNSRTCNTCNRIRMARMINEYLPKAKQMIEQPVFLTLTAQTIPLEKLDQRIDEMQRIFRIILQYKYKKGNTLYKKNLTGLRKLELTYNPLKDTFHPHYHVLLDGLWQAKIIRDLWIKKWNSRGVPCVKEAQSILKADERTYLELAKYGVKDCVAQGKKFDYKKMEFFHPSIMNNMYEALDRRRIYQPFGKLSRATLRDEVCDLKADPSLTSPEPKFCSWTGDNWYDLGTGEALVKTGKLTDKYQKIADELSAWHMNELDTRVIFMHPQLRIRLARAQHEVALRGSPVHIFNSRMQTIEELDSVKRENLRY